METQPRSVMTGRMLAGLGRGGRTIPGGTASNGLMTTRRLANGERFSMMARLAVESELVQPARQLVGGYMSEVGALVALDFDAAAVGFDGPAGTGQAEPGAARLSRAGIVHAIETLEAPLAMRSGHAGSRVAHVDRDAAGLGRGVTQGLRHLHFVLDGQPAHRAQRDMGASMAAPLT